MEIETKILGLDIRTFKKKLKELEKIYSGKNITIFFDNGALGKNCALRLRNFNNKRAELTYKGPKKKSKYKVREEINLHVDDFNACRHILNSSGFKEIEILKNRRESYDLILGKKSYHIDIDYYDGLEPFVEIEAKTEQELEYILDYLQISKDRLFNGSVHELRKLSHHKHKNL